MRQAAVVIVSQSVPGSSTHRLLTVWNERYRSWTLPGGLVHEGETPEAGAARELYEETGLRAPVFMAIYDAPVERVRAEQRGEHVHVFEAHGWIGTPSEREAGCPVKWMAPSQFLELCIFREFYAKMSDALRLDWRASDPA